MVHNKVCQAFSTSEKQHPMLTMRAGKDRGFADHGWLKSFHSFSFAAYSDPLHMGFGNLRVINEDRIAGGTGFGTHGHRDMEILSYVMDGALAHQDNMGNGTSMVPGDLQRMTAGKGVMHSEFNHSQNAAAHFLQIWIQPNELGIAPSYEQKHFDASVKRGKLCLLASATGEQGSVKLHADASLFAGLFHGDEQAQLAIPTNCLAYVHVVSGNLLANGRALQAGDALKYEGESQVHLERGEQAEVLVFILTKT
jgi:quercetin 2,3-dioxygenase